MSNIHSGKIVVIELSILFSSRHIYSFTNHRVVDVINQWIDWLEKNAFNPLFIEKGGESQKGGRNKENFQSSFHRGREFKLLCKDRRRTFNPLFIEPLISFTIKLNLSFKLSILFSSSFIMTQVSKKCRDESFNPLFIEDQKRTKLDQGKYSPFNPLFIEPGWHTFRPLDNIMHFQSSFHRVIQRFIDILTRYLNFQSSFHREDSDKAYHWENWQPLSILFSSSY